MERITLISNDDRIQCGLLMEAKHVPQIFHPYSNPLGKSFIDWSVLWWRWFISIPRKYHPALDMIGNNAHTGQILPNVMFLCQTMESVIPFPIRTVTLQRGSCIFMPIINWVSILHVDGENDVELTSVAKTRMDLVENMKVTIGNKVLTKLWKKYRFHSGVIDVMLPDDNILDQSRGPSRLVSDGYWLFTKPLNNNIKIRTFGTCSSGVTRIGVTYDIQVS